MRGSLTSQQNFLNRTNGSHYVGGRRLGRISPIQAAPVLILAQLLIVDFAHNYIVDNFIFFLNLLFFPLSVE